MESEPERSWLTTTPIKVLSLRKIWCTSELIGLDQLTAIDSFNSLWPEQFENLFGIFLMCARIRFYAVF